MRRRLTQKLKIALAGLVGGFAFACGAPTQPGEMPPLASRPDQVQPAPSPRPDPRPVPGAPDPLDPARTGPTVPSPSDAGVPLTMITPPDFRASGSQPAHAPGDAGVPPASDGGMSDAAVLPPTLPDALPADASKRADQ
ncbi:MAG: hypothetical protein H0T89_13810 [Deltaproteobacteria bacterium]|nr:hypothetical protein [Deltaproteobacteria bacterium]MDQ3301163.1 hypothetical protein [Myxococcota bacterium]